MREPLSSAKRFHRREDAVTGFVANRPGVESVIRALRRMIPKGVFRAVSPFYHFFMAFWSALFYGFPSRRLYVIGVTGTKGKTTVVHLLHHLLASSGARVASSSSLRTPLPGVSVAHPFKKNIPGAVPRHQI